MENNMATKQVDGSAYSVPPNRVSSGAVNNHGTAARVGSLASNKLSNVAVSRYNSTVFASTVVDNDSADKAVDAGTFAYNNSDPVSMRVTSSLAGAANTFLLSGADVPSLVDSIHYLKVLTTRRFATAIRANKYNRFTGAFDSGFPVVADDTLDTDTAATPTRAVPGQLTYKLGQPVPVSDNDYKAKTG